MTQLLATAALLLLTLASCTQVHVTVNGDNNTTTTSVTQMYNTTATIPVSALPGGLP